MMSRLTLLLLLALCVSFAACSESEDAPAKGDESGVPAMDGKADLFWAPTLHGALAFGEDGRGTFAEHALFHAWDFALTDTSEIALDAQPVDPNVDTVMYLYRRDAGTSSWGSYIARNDDHDGGLGSHIEGAFEPGEYRILLKAHKDTIRGTFVLGGQCAGAGCPPQTQGGTVLDDQQKTQALEALDAICGDTFCAGDYNYRMQDLVCASTGVCTFTFDVGSYDQNGGWTMSLLQQSASDSLVTSGLATDGTGKWVARLIETVDVSPEVWIRGECVLDGQFVAATDVVEQLSYGPKVADRFYDHVIDCIFGIESLVQGVEAN